MEKWRAKATLMRTMKPAPSNPIFFATPVDFREWLEPNHAATPALWVGYYKRDSGKPSMTWPESVDEALCFGWIDGLRKGIDAESYMIRFTPRKITSNWSAVNIRRMQELVRQGRVHPTGLKAFAARAPEKSGVYSYENRRAAKLTKADEKLFRAQRGAWEFFQTQPESYRITATWWVVTAKRDETRRERLKTLIADSKAKRRIKQLRRPGG
jgi:uncharacterized protein YdeI (YjbR/CyaY-like superfamily)